jgi:23S rRNA-/tRNA-specific pseudouridylate synthase
MIKIDSVRERRFVVSGSAAKLLGIIDTLAPNDVHALRDGRIFVDGKRADASVQFVNPGSYVTWYAPRAAPRWSDVAFRVLDRRGDVLIVAKPAHWSSEPDRSGNRESLRERVSDSLDLPNLHIATRLDAGVSGLVAIATGRQARRTWARLHESRGIEKAYLGIALGTVSEQAQWRTPIDGARSALTVSHRLATCDPIRFSGFQSTASLLRIEPVTGRTHQIRVHASTNAHPLLGDRRYGGPTQWVTLDGSVRGIARPMLHAWRLSLTWEGEPWTTVCPAPDDMRELWAEFGGADAWPVD